MSRGPEVISLMVEHSNQGDFTGALLLLLICEKADAQVAREATF